MHFLVDGLGEYAPAYVAVGKMFGYMFYGFVVQGIACKPIGDVLHLPAALEGGVHGEYVLVGGKLYPFVKTNLKEKKRI